MVVVRFAWTGEASSPWGAIWLQGNEYGHLGVDMCGRIGLDLVIAGKNRGLSRFYCPCLRDIPLKINELQFNHSARAVAAEECLSENRHRNAVPHRFMVSAVNLYLIE